MQFQDKFLNRDAAGGGEAAEELLKNVKGYMSSELLIDADSTEVVVRAYANLKGLQSACVQNAWMKVGSSLKCFGQGFTQRRALFDFVDVGAGKERADHKIKGGALRFVLYTLIADSIHRDFEATCQRSTMCAHPAWRLP